MYHTHTHTQTSETSSDALDMVYSSTQWEPLKKDISPHNTGTLYYIYIDFNYSYHNIHSTIHTHTHTHTTHAHWCRCVQLSIAITLITIQLPVHALWDSTRPYCLSCVYFMYMWIYRILYTGCTCIHSWSGQVCIEQVRVISQQLGISTSRLSKREFSRIHRVLVEVWALVISLTV